MGSAYELYLHTFRALAPVQLDMYDELKGHIFSLGGNHSALARHCKILYCMVIRTNFVIHKSYRINTP